MSGDKGDDVLYGGNAGVTSQNLFGDSAYSGSGIPELGGNDTIFGGDDGAEE